MNSKNFDPNSLYNKLQSATNIVGTSQFSSTPDQEVHVNIRADKSISPGKFKPDPVLAGGFKAHPTTIAAMRKDVFVGGNDCFEDLEYLYQCTSCKDVIDLQFWQFCPFCEAKFPNELPKPLKS